MDLTALNLRFASPGTHIIQETDKENKNHNFKIMKLHKHALLFLLLILFQQCDVDYGIELPTEVSFGTTMVYINGELRNFQNYSYSDITSDNKRRLLIKFGENINNDEFINSLGGLTYWPVSNTEYELTDTKTEEEMSMQVSFSQIYDGDLPGWAYRLMQSDDNYFLLETFDTLNHIISGRGLLKFKRTTKNGIAGGSDLDQIIECEFVFNDHYLPK